MRTDPFRYDENDIGRGAGDAVRVGIFPGYRLKVCTCIPMLLHLIVHAHRDGSGGGRRSAKDTHSQDGPRVCLSAVYRLI
jgi:hypothetical protein